MKYRYMIFMPLLMLTACNPFSKAKDVKKLATLQPARQILSMPVIPASISSVKDQEVYLATHYWDNLDVNLVNSGYNKQKIEQQFVNYLDLLTVIPVVQAKVNIGMLLNRIVDNRLALRQFMRLFEHYLYEQQSPFKNEEQYITVLEYVVRSSKVDEVNKIRPHYLLNMLYKNRMGNVATDFTYITASGGKGNLMSLKSPYILMFFYDPDCEHCRLTVNELKNNPLLKDMLIHKKLSVLAVYTESKSKLWLDYKFLIPSQWINVSDQEQITRQKKYDLRALPSLYLLDSDKKVLLKDVSAGVLLDYLYKERVKSVYTIPNSK